MATTGQNEQTAVAIFAKIKQYIAPCIDSENMISEIWEVLDAAEDV